MYSSLSKILSSVTRVIAIIFAVAIVVLAYQGKMSVGEFSVFATLVLKHFFDTSSFQANQSAPKEVIPKDPVGF